MADSRMADSRIIAAAEKDDELDIDLDEMGDQENVTGESYRDAGTPKLKRVTKNTQITYNNGCKCFSRAMVKYGMTVQSLASIDINVEMFHTFAGLALFLKKRDGSSYATSVLSEYYRKFE
jgi:hypothetical protein